jgi:hypothetical protein
MTNELDRWLRQATQCLANDSAGQVVSEIREHYESAREAAIAAGARPDDADEAALALLGDAKIANRQYRKVLLTSGEARLLRRGNWQGRAICSRPRLKRLLVGLPAAAALAASYLFYAGVAEAGRVLLAAGVAMTFGFIAPLLPIYTPARSRIVRYARGIVVPAALILAFGAHAPDSSWLIFASLWPMVWIEWTRMSIRRKLPVARWPKHLYL